MRGRFRLALEVGERRGEVRVGELRLDQEPRLAVAHDQKVHFAFLFVAQVGPLSRLSQNSPDHFTMPAKLVLARLSGASCPDGSAWHASTPSSASVVSLKFVGKTG